MSRKIVMTLVCILVLGLSGCGDTLTLNQYNTSEIWYIAYTDIPVHVALGAAEPIEAKNPLIILVDKPAQSLKASSCMLPLTSSGNVLFAEGEKLQESFDESKLIDYGSIEEFQMNH